MTEPFSVAQTWRALCVLLVIATTVVLAVLLMMRYVFPEPEVFGWCCRREGTACAGNFDADRCIGEGGYAFAMNEATCMLTCDTPSPPYALPASN